MAQKHNEEQTNAPMTRLGTMALSGQQRIIRSSAFAAEKFTTDNPILQLGEMGYETDTGLLKVGDGVTAWSDLPYVGGGAGELPNQTGNAGKFLTTDGTDASWGAVDTLPSQTGNSGKFLTTDGTDASWGTTIKPITITPSTLYYTSVVTLKGYNNNNDILYMNMAPSTGQFEIDVRNNTGTRTGWYFFDSAFYPHQTMLNLTLGKSTNKWDNVYTTKINNGTDITVPTTGGTMVVATPPTTDGTYVLKATVSSGVVTYTWVAE